MIVQGFGNVGSMAAMLMHEAGYKIVGVADIHGALYNENGFDIPKMIDWVYHAAKATPGISAGWREIFFTGSAVPAVRYFVACRG